MPLITKIIHCNANNFFEINYKKAILMSNNLFLAFIDLFLNYSTDLVCLILKTRGVF